jgi:general secretion pathway protein G
MIRTREIFMTPPIKKQHNILRNEAGFSLIELIMVVSIIAILSTLAINGLYEIREKAKVARATEEIRGLEKDIIAYAAERGEYPPDLAAVNQAGALDPWGTPYVYTTTPGRTWMGPKINTDFDLYSKGADRNSTDPSLQQPGSPDDIVRGGDGAYSGIAGLYGT